MIICRTPFRTSFFGGGTDYPVWFEEHGGAVLTAAINRYCYISCRYLPPFFEHKSRVVWSQIERVTDHEAIQHPVIRAVLDYLGIEGGVEIHHQGDLPARSGLGSSSSFTVGLLHALYALKGKMIGHADLADQAIHVERDVLKEHVGVQDQIQTAFGGINRIDIRTDHSFRVEPVIMSAERRDELQSHLVLFFTGLSRSASDIAKQKIAKIPSHKDDLHAMRAMVDEGLGILTNGSDLADFGRLLDEAWARKRKLTEGLQPPHIDDIYRKARAAGALGGKLLGAGGGGFMLFFAPPEKHAAIAAGLAPLLAIPVGFDFGGSQIIFYEREDEAPRPSGQ
ncbi:MAG: kinase [Rhodospirillales bacterium]|nr:MAG: kinase [Rhodospirillales bacterium]